MRPLVFLLLPGLLASRLVNAQTAQPTGKLLVDKKLVARFISQTDLLRKTAVGLHFHRQTAPVEEWMSPEPGDKWVTYTLKGDTMIFYQSGRTATLYRCSLHSAARYARTVPFLASTPAALFAGKYRTYTTFRIAESAVNEQYELKLTFQNNRLRRLFFDVNTSDW